MLCADNETFVILISLPLSFRSIVGSREEVLFYWCSSSMQNPWWWLFASWNCFSGV